MVRTHTVFFQRPQVKRSRITHVPIESILRIPRMQFAHAGVASRLGQDRCGGNTGDPAVTADDGLGAAGQLRAVLAVNERMHRPRAMSASEGCDGALHGQQAGLQDVDPVNLRDARCRHGPGQCPGTDRLGQDLSLIHI